MAIEYRSFLNTDPPHILRLWHECSLGRGAAQGFPCDVLEYLVFGQIDFDPRGLIVALDGNRRVGFVHAGFGCNADETGLDRTAGVVCAVMVHPSHRRQGIGRELMQRAEQYLRDAGTTSIQAGPAAPRDPFYLGIYSGSEPAGFLESDTAAGPFLAALGYQPVARRVVFQRDLSIRSEPVDFRLVAIRRTMQLGMTDVPARMSRWWVTRYGRFETLRFLLLPKKSDAAVAEIACWGLDLYAPRWGARAVGLSALVVNEPQRRKGYAKTLLLELFHRLRQEQVGLIEVHADSQNEAAIKLLKSFGFQQIDTGVVYLR
ncbi:MAG TPA: GNAT family N-acetyltransferase [Planctomycetaceae bacterium]|nr:GNAT family N-acetyltransferase [Planctomycetaceae bacterium]